MRAFPPRRGGSAPSECEAPGWGVLVKFEGLPLTRLSPSGFACPLPQGERATERDDKERAVPTTAEKRRVFRALHARGCFVIPNPWDIGTARYLQHLGFQAIATTSSGAAWSLGLPDTAVGRDAMLAHIAAIVAASDLAVNADFESGYAASPREVGESVLMCVDTGVAGLSIEDSSGDASNPLFSLEDAVARIRAARSAIDAEDP